ncbi:MAG: PAS domain-containing protein [Deltaproteobacteria bacterium]|nr:PAS domain-containing protein [Deltaproteobacteria bacterium]
MRRPAQLAKPVRPRRAAAADHVAAEVLANLVEGVVVIDRGHRVVRMNPAAERITGRSEARAVGALLADSLPHNPEVVRLAQRCLDTGGSAANRIVTLACPPREPLPVEVLASPWIDADGQVAGAVLVFMDRTPLQAIAEEVRRGDRVAMAEALGARLAHEVRNPLGGIQGAAQLLARRAAGRRDLEECVEVIVREVNRLDALVGSVLELARDTERPRQSVNVHLLLDEVIQLLRADPATRDVEVRCFFDPSLPEIRVDVQAFVRVLRNLVRNAAEAQGRAGTIELATAYATDYSRVLRAGSSARFVKIEVRDEGPGIPPEIKERIFTPLFTTKNTGTGLGLAIALKVVEDHGGFMRVLNRSPRGSIFEVYVPIDAARERREATP